MTARPPGVSQSGVREPLVCTRALMHPDPHPSTPMYANTCVHRCAHNTHALWPMSTHIACLHTSLCLCKHCCQRTPVCTSHLDGLADAPSVPFPLEQVAVLLDVSADVLGGEAEVASVAQGLPHTVLDRHGHGAVAAVKRLWRGHPCPARLTKEKMQRDMRPSNFWCSKDFTCVGTLSARTDAWATGGE